MAFYIGFLSRIGQFMHDIFLFRPVESGQLMHDIFCFVLWKSGKLMHDMFLLCWTVNARYGFFFIL